jgi:excinuclease ABC subunit C
VLYVGKAARLRDRLRDWFSPREKHSLWVEAMIARATDFDFVVTDSELEALILEANLIKEYSPRYNIRLADDKSYPYLKITLEEDFPRLIVLRDLPKDARVPDGRLRSTRGLWDPKGRALHAISRGRYFGPYASAHAMRATMQILSRLFGLCRCRRNIEGTKKRPPCLNYHMGQCLGACAGLCTKEEYRAAVQQALRFLEGKSSTILPQLKRQMQEASARLDFERAARYRDQIKALERVLEEQKITAGEARDEDILAAAVRDDRACVQVFQVRAGRLVEQAHYLLQRAQDRAPEEVLEAFMLQHYTSATHIPKTVYTAQQLAEAALLGEWLGERRGNRVEVVRPQRGEKRRLAELSEKNAATMLEQVAQTEHERQRLAELTLNQLQEALGLTGHPRRIECFDISTLGGTQSVASMVVFQDAAPLKAAYRRFRMKWTEGKPDDYAMMQEALRRRLASAQQGDPKFLPLPDLVLLDGGKGQVSAVEEVLAEWHLPDLPLAGLAKEHEQVFVPGRSDPVDVEPGSRAHHLLIRLRDEAHRFAQGYHHLLRDKTTRQSALDEAPGIGPRRKQRLLQHFKSPAKIREATAEELAEAAGIGRKAAEALWAHLRGEK